MGNSDFGFDVFSLHMQLC